MDQLHGSERGGLITHKQLYKMILFAKQSRHKDEFLWISMLNPMSPPPCGLTAVEATQGKCIIIYFYLRFSLCCILWEIYILCMHIMKNI